MRRAATSENGRAWPTPADARAVARPAPGAVRRRWLSPNCARSRAPRQGGTRPCLQPNCLLTTYSRIASDWSSTSTSSSHSGGARFLLVPRCAIQSIMAPPQMKSACFATLLHSRSAGTNGASRIASSIARADSVIPTMAAIQMNARSCLNLLAPAVRGISLTLTPSSRRLLKKPRFGGAVETAEQ